MAANLAPEIILKNPQEQKLTQFSFENDITAQDEEIVRVVTVTIDPQFGVSPLVALGTGFSADQAQVFLSGGTAGQDYTVEVVVETEIIPAGQAGPIGNTFQRLTGCGILRVREC